MGCKMEGCELTHCRGCGEHTLGAEICDLCLELGYPKKEYVNRDEIRKPTFIEIEIQKLIK